MSSEKPKEEEQDKSDKIEIIDIDKWVRQTLFARRILTLNWDIDDEIKEFVTHEILALSNLSNEPIHLMLSSWGGDIGAMWYIHDIMKYCSSPVYTYAAGEVCSAAAVLFICGEEGHRFMLPHATLMIHQPWEASAARDVTQSQIDTSQLKKERKRITKALIQSTGLDRADIEAYLERDSYFSAAEAVKIGLADKILRKNTKIGEQ